MLKQILLSCFAASTLLAQPSTIRVPGPVIISQPGGTDGVSSNDVYNIVVEYGINPTNGTSPETVTNIVQAFTANALTNNEARPARFTASVAAPTVYADAVTATNSSTLTLSGGDETLVIGSGGVTATAAGGFIGSGVNLTDLDASELTSGTLPYARLPFAVLTNNYSLATRLTASLATPKIYTDNIEATNSSGLVLSGGSVELTLTSGAASINAPYYFSGSGLGLTSLNASQLGSGTVPLARLPSSVLTNSYSLPTRLTDSLATPIVYTDSVHSTNAGPLLLISSVGLLTIGGGAITADDAPSGFVGVGTGLTALNAANLGSGIVPTARLGSGTANSSTFLRGDNTWATPVGTVQTNIAVAGVTNAGTMAYTNASAYNTYVAGLDTTVSNGAIAFSVVVTNRPGLSNVLRSSFADISVTGGGSSIWTTNAAAGGYRNTNDVGITIYDAAVNSVRHSPTGMVTYANDVEAASYGSSLLMYAGNQIMSLSAGTIFGAGGEDRISPWNAGLYGNWTVYGDGVSEDGDLTVQGSLNVAGSMNIVDEVQTPLFLITNYGVATTIESNTITTGTITADAFIGDGSGLTNLPNSATRLTYNGASLGVNVSSTERLNDIGASQAAQLTVFGQAARSPQTSGYYTNARLYAVNASGTAWGTGTNTSIYLKTNNVISPFGLHLITDGTTTLTNSGTASLSVTANTLVAWGFTNNQASAVGAYLKMTVEFVAQ